MYVLDLREPMVIVSHHHQAIAGFEGLFTPQNAVPNLLVELSLEDENGTQVFFEKAQLINWVWSGAVGASQSDLYTLKTTFEPKKGKVYYLKLNNNEGNLNAAEAKILLMGGGWKAL